MYSKEKKIEDEYTRTIIGSVIIQRPIDNCFQTGWERDDGTPPLNRTFTNEFVTVDKSSLQGYGIFAAVDIEQYTHVLVEKPFFSTERWDQISVEHAALGDQEKAVFDGLAGYHTTHEDPVVQKYSANQQVQT